MSDLRKRLDRLEAAAAARLPEPRPLPPGIAAALDADPECRRLSEALDRRLRELPGGLQAVAQDPEAAELAAELLEAITRATGDADGPADRITRRRP